MVAFGPGDRLDLRKILGQAFGDHSLRALLSDRAPVIGSA
jgi:hypothetical protein